MQAVLLGLAKSIYYVTCIHFVNHMYVDVSCNFISVVVGAEQSKYYQLLWSSKGKGNLFYESVSYFFEGEGVGGVQGLNKRYLFFVSLNVSFIYVVVFFCSKGHVPP